MGMPALFAAWAAGRVPILLTTPRSPIESAPVSTTSQPRMTAATAASTARVTRTPAAARAAARERPSKLGRPSRHTTSNERRLAASSSAARTVDDDETVSTRPPAGMSPSARAAASRLADRMRSRNRSRARRVAARASSTEAVPDAARRTVAASVTSGAMEGCASSVRAASRERNARKSSTSVAALSASAASKSATALPASSAAPPRTSARSGATRASRSIGMANLGSPRGASNGGSAACPERARRSRVGGSARRGGGRRLARAVRAAYNWHGRPGVPTLRGDPVRKESDPKMALMLPEVARPPLTLLTEEEQLLRQTVREFAEQEVAPRVRAMDEAGQMDPDLITQLFELGVMGVEVPEQWGGTAASFFTAVLIVEELSRVDPAVGVLVDVQNTLVNNCILKYGTEEQKERYLPRLARDMVGSYALSEAGSGSDAFSLATRAVRTDGGWRLEGQKLWITNGAEAGLFIVFANAKIGSAHV